jgi:hypothetical protein
VGQRSRQTRNDAGLETGALPASSLPLATPRAVRRARVALMEAPPVARPREIHPRRNIPRVPEGIDRPDPTPTPALAIAPAAARAAGARAADDLTLVKNVALGAAAGGFASNVGEPSVASRGDVVFYTGNWYAALSTDGGATFRFIDPNTAFPDPPGLAFCCDQVVHYIRPLDAFVWLMQYVNPQDQFAANIQRLAFARTADVAQGSWAVVDITPQNLGLPNVFLDFPDLAVGTNMLYVTMVGFLGNDWTATVLVRMPLSGIDALLRGTGDATAQQTVSRENFTFRVAQHSTTRAFWASHNTTSSLRMFSWPETAPQPTFRDVAVARWAERPFRSATPEEFDWLGRADPRPLGATRRPGDELWFAWGSARGGANDRPHPFVQIARIDARGTTPVLRENINLWDPDAATNYAAITTNSGGEVGASYMMGGPAMHPSHVVGILTGSQRFVVAGEGAHGPRDQEWGDYLTVRRHYGTTQRLFTAAGYTLDRGTGRQDGNPRFVQFGRSADVR